MTAANIRIVNRGQNGTPIPTSVELDGREVPGLVNVKVDIGHGHLNTVTLTLEATVDLDAFVTEFKIEQPTARAELTEQYVQVEDLMRQIAEAHAHVRSGGGFPMPEQIKAMADGLSAALRS